jgi:hypothetical protein
MAVYDPWPEYQRQQEEMLAQRAVENASGEEEKRKAEAAHLEEERRREGLRKKAEEAERARQTALLNVKQTQPSTKAQAQPTTDDIGSASGGLSGEASLEAEIRAMMSKMRELNNKDPKLLARIWEEERRVKTPSSPTAQAKLTPQSSTVQTGPSSALVVANQRKKAVPKESPAAADLAMSQTTAPVAVPNSAMRPQSQAIATGAVRPTGNTMWPPERREQLAAAAAAYLNGQNPNNPVTADRILSMLEGNPSYIELCGHLEVMSLKLDRGAFAKSLLTAVPDANSGSRSQLQVQNRPSGQIAAPQTSGSAGQRTSASPATMTKRNSNPPHIAPTQFHTPITQSPLSRLAHPQLHNNNVSAPHSLVPTAEFLPTNPKSKSPANKEEAARKRNFNEIIDLTAADEEDDMEPMHKRPNLGSTFSAQSPAPTFANAMDVDEGICRVDNVTTAVSVSSQPLQIQGPSLSAPLPPHDNLRMQTVVKPLDKSIALRRSCYNIKTIARDVLLACGRHPQERQLNAHLDILKTSLGSYVSIDSDLSTLRWDLIDPGIPPRGFYRDAVQSVAEDADDEDESEGEGGRSGRPPPPTSHAIGVGGAKAQALHPSNPFKQKRRGRPPQHPYPDNMDASAPRSKAAAEGVGYAAFRSATAYDAEGKPLPKKKGRPVGWRKAIHGSAAVQANKHNNPQPDSVQSVPTQYRQLRNVDTNENQPSKVASRSPHEGNMAMRYQSFNCKWQNCKAELHNLETLKKHVHKRHRKETEKGSLECLWGDCGREVTHVDPITSTRIEFHSPFTFTEDSEWRNHLELRHFVPLSWELGDGPATGLSGTIHSPSDCSTSANFT